MIDDLMMTCNGFLGTCGIKLGLGNNKNNGKLNKGILIVHGEICEVVSWAPH